MVEMQQVADPVLGFVYIGKAGRDPATCPIDVFSDEALTTIARQPLTFTRNTKPAIFVAAPSCSMRITDRHGKEVFSQIECNPEGGKTLLSGKFIKVGTSDDPVWINPDQIRAFWGVRPGTTRVYFDYSSVPDDDGYTNDGWIEINMPPEQFAALLGGIA